MAIIFSVSPVETTKLAILGEENIEISQGNPLNVEIMCLNDEGELTQGWLMSKV